MALHHFFSLALHHFFSLSCDNCCPPPQQNRCPARREHDHVEFSILHNPYMALYVLAFLMAVQSVMSYSTPTHTASRLVIFSWLQMHTKSRCCGLPFSDSVWADVSKVHPQIYLRTDAFRNDLRRRQIPGPSRHVAPLLPDHSFSNPALIVSRQRNPPSAPCLPNSSFMFEV